MNDGHRENPRMHGNAPFRVAVVHGGPGAGGEMAAVARELAAEWGVVEPLQTATSLEGQVDELRTALATQGDPPLTLIGFSWGAWLSAIVAARHPGLARKLVLIGSAPYRDEYAAGIEERRLSRLSFEEKAEAARLAGMLECLREADSGPALARLGALFSKADAFDPFPDRPAIIKPDVGVFLPVWREAVELRRSGELLALVSRIECPVVAIHGDHDPHPAEGVREPLSATLKRFRFILLNKCGHKPWIERQARVPFYEILRKELGPAD